VAALLTLFLMSFLYKDNRFFRFAEALFAGVSLGYYIGTTLDQTLRPNLIEPLAQNGVTPTNFHLLFAGLLGLNLYTRYFPRIAWLARLSLAVYVRVLRRHQHGAEAPGRGAAAERGDHGRPDGWRQRGARRLQRDRRLRRRDLGAHLLLLSLPHDGVSGA